MKYFQENDEQSIQHIDQCLGDGISRYFNNCSRSQQIFTQLHGVRCHQTRESTGLQPSTPGSPLPQCCLFPMLARSHSHGVHGQVSSPQLSLQVCPRHCSCCNRHHRGCQTVSWIPRQPDREGAGTGWILVVDHSSSASSSGILTLQHRSNSSSNR